MDMASRVISIDVNNMLKTIFDDTTLQVQVLDLNTESQMYDKGINSEGDQIGEYS